MRLIGRAIGALTLAAMTTAWAVLVVLVALDAYGVQRHS